MVISRKVYVTESYLASSFCPVLLLVLVALLGKYRNEHTLAKEGSFLYHIYNGEALNSFFPVFATEEKPIIIPVSIDIVLNKQVKLTQLLVVDISSTNIAIFKIGIDFISHNLILPFLLFHLFEILPVVVY